MQTINNTRDYAINRFHDDEMEGSDISTISCRSAHQIRSDV